MLPSQRLQARTCDPDPEHASVNRDRETVQLMQNHRRL